LNIDAPDDVAEQLEEIARAVARRGIEVRRVGGPEDLNGLTDRAAYWYGGPLVSSRLTSRLAIGLLEPEDAWLPSLGRRYTGRRIEAATLEAAWALTRPAFVKPPSDKSFPAQVYLDGSHLPSRGAGLAPETPALISDVMSLACEYRLFLLDGAVAAASRYAVFGRLDVAPLEGDPREREVRAFAATLTRRLRYSLPSAVVVDIGLAADPDTGRERWVVVEANMAWFAHCYAADPDRVLDVVLRSAGPLKDIAEKDFGHLRSRARWQMQLGPRDPRSYPSDRHDLYAANPARAGGGRSDARGVTMRKNACPTWAVAV
jgi:hypothetical protein